MVGWVVGGAGWAVSWPEAGWLAGRQAGWACTLLAAGSLSQADIPQVRFHLLASRAPRRSHLPLPPLPSHCYPSALLSVPLPCRAVGAFSWFPVHGTSMNNTNTLISGDNKGAAAQFMERWAAAQAAGAAGAAQEEAAAQQQQSEQQQHSEQQRQQQQRQQRGSSGRGAGVAAGGLVAAFCQANVGDTSPNTQGAFCADSGQPCDAVHSTCGGRVQQCIGRGPGWPDNFASTRIIGQAQADKAQELLLGGGESPPAKHSQQAPSVLSWRLSPARDGSHAARLFLSNARPADSAHVLPVLPAGLEELDGPIDFRHAFLDMRGIRVAASNFTQAGTTCKPAMGFAFAAGTTDGEPASQPANQRGKQQWLWH